MGSAYAPGDGDGPGERPRPWTPIERAVAAARSGGSSVLLEGVHALKHAVRFGARVELVVTPDRAHLHRLLDELAPDVALPVDVQEVDAARWQRLAPRELPSPVLAVAARPPPRWEPALSSGDGRLVVLEQPRHLGNLGAAVRVAAAAGAEGLLVVGDADPWHPTAVRAAAGLQFALPVGRISQLPSTSRPLVALDPGGERLDVAGLPAGAALLFGTERAGLTPRLRARATTRVSIPMQPGVSSLNLATAVGIVLYAP